jgi:NAD(P)-dependent dehydrogenase (short-subunit alcohol dehydrogenase family)
VTAVVGPEDDVNFMNHSNLSVYALDLFNESSAEKSIQEIITKEGSYSFAVFTVGGFGMGGFPDTSLEDIRKMIRLNFETAYTSARVLFNHYKQEKIQGRIILIGARPGLTLHKSVGTVAYGLSKSLVFSLAELINVSGHDLGIDATVIVPSIIDTPANRKAIPDADFSKWVQPGHIAENIYFLSTEAGKELRDSVFKVYGKS